MTDRDELVEKVAQIYKEVWCEHDHWRASAAIDIVLEEAAGVADDKTIGANSNDVFDAGWASACADIAAAIRAMISRNP